MGGINSGGRNKKSVEQHLLEGTFRKDRHGQKPQSQTEAPTCPGWLSLAAKAEWRRVTPELKHRGMLTKLDRVALAMYCQTYAHLRKAEEELEDGLTYEYTNKNGSTNRVQKPEVRMVQQFMKTINTLCADFGFTPSSRGQMVIPDESEEEDPLDEFLNTGKMN